MKENSTYTKTIHFASRLKRGPTYKETGNGIQIFLPTGRLLAMNPLGWRRYFYNEIYESASALKYLYLLRRKPYLPSNKCLLCSKLIEPFCLK